MKLVDNFVVGWVDPGFAGVVGSGFNEEVLQIKRCRRHFVQCLVKVTLVLHRDYGDGAHR